MKRNLLVIVAAVLTMSYGYSQSTPYTALNQAQNDQARATVYYRMASDFDRSKFYDSAIHYYNEAAMYFGRAEDDLAMAGCFLDMGRAYVKKSPTKQEMHAAMPHFDRAIVIFRKKKDKTGLAEALFEKAKLLLVFQKNEEALAFGHEALINFGFNSRQATNEILQCYNLLATAYKANGDKQKSEFYYQAFLSGQILEHNDPMKTKKLEEISRKRAMHIDSLEKQKLQRELEIARMQAEQSLLAQKAAELEKQNLQKNQIIQQQQLQLKNQIIDLQGKLMVSAVVLVILFITTTIASLLAFSRKSASNRILIKEKRLTDQNATALLIENQQRAANESALAQQLHDLQINYRQLSKLNREKDKLIAVLETELIGQIPYLVSTLQKALTLREGLTDEQAFKIESIQRSLRKWQKARQLSTLKA